MFQHPAVSPKVIPLELLRNITNNFSKEQELGSGVFGTVYKGVEDGEEVAVKLLRAQGHGDREQFIREFENISQLSHQNIVQLIGYCHEKGYEYVEVGNGRFVLVDKIYIVLCFEYMHNGSLRQHLSDEYSGLSWQTRYIIIKGICEGLKYLHEALKYHLDLKPENILLDKTMVPKIADFGLLELFHNDQTEDVESYIVGTREYMPPEYKEKNIVSIKFDIFSLGVVMIRIMTGYEGYYKKAEMSSQEFIELVHGNWRNRLMATSSGKSLEAECHQVRRCIEVALDCVHTEWNERPEIGDILHWLNETEHMIENTEQGSKEAIPPPASTATANVVEVVALEPQPAWSGEPPLSVDPPELQFPCTFPFLSTGLSILFG